LQVPFVKAIGVEKQRLGSGQAIKRRIVGFHAAVRVGACRYSVGEVARHTGKARSV
jgi:hypothetical protein